MRNESLACAATVRSQNRPRSPAATEEIQKAGEQMMGLDCGILQSTAETGRLFQLKNTYKEYFAGHLKERRTISSDLVCLFMQAKACSSLLT